jgi:hypothetical protein
VWQQSSPNQQGSRQFIITVKPNFFIAGAPKCGTTALYQYLRPHPNIFMPEVKEPHFFAKDFGTYPRIKTPEKYQEISYLDCCMEICHWV